MNRRFLRKEIQIVLILVFILSVMVSGQARTAKDSEDSRLREEILTVYRTGGEQGLKGFVKKNEDAITDTFIVDFADAGRIERNEKWLKIALLLAEEKKAGKTQADVLYRAGEYYRLIGEKKKAGDCHDKAFNIYRKSGNSVGQGNVYIAKGLISYSGGDNDGAIEMYKKALHIFEKAGELKGQSDVYRSIGEAYLRTGNYPKALEQFDKSLSIYSGPKSAYGRGTIYWRKGQIYYRKGDNQKALEMYDTALNFFEKTKEPIGQGNVYHWKGDIFLQTGDHARAVEMYDKGLSFFEKAKEPIGQGNIYLKKGTLYLTVGNNSGALEMYEKALPFFRKGGSLIGQGNIYMRMGNLYARFNDNPQALKMYDKALPFFEKAGEPIGQGNTWLCMGIIYANYGDKDKALEVYDKALVFYEKARQLVGIANTYLRKGSVYTDVGDYERALEMYDRALPNFKKVGQSIGQGNLYLKKGMLYKDMYRYSQALEMYESAQSFYEKVGDLLGQGNVRQLIGDIYKNSGKHIKALEMYDEALPYFDKMGNINGQANIYSNKAAVYFNTGEGLKVLEMYDKALQLYKKAGSFLGRGNVYLGKGDLYFKVGGNLKSLEMYDKALKMFEEVRHFRSQGFIHERKGNLYLIAGDHSRAIEMYDRALPIFKKLNSAVGQGLVYWRKGEINFREGEDSKALEMYKKAHDFFGEAGQAVNQAEVSLKKALVYYRKGKYLDSLPLYDNALAIFGKAGMIEKEAYAFHDKARALVKLGEKKKALALLEKAIVNLEKIRMQTVILELKQHFLEKVYKRYEQAVIFMLENKLYEKSFKYSEMIRTRIFLDRMAEGFVRTDKGLAGELETKRDELVAKISMLSKEIHKAAGGKNEKKFQQIKEMYRETENEFEELLVKIRLNNPLYASVRYPQPISVQALQREVLKKNEVLLRYFISSERTYVFLVSQDKFNVFAFDIKEKEINDTVRAYLQAIREKNDRRTERYAGILYRKLFRPLEPQIKKSNEIILVPDGRLATVPFESFVVGKKKGGRPQFLLEKYRIKYIQGATLLSVLRKHYRRDKETDNFVGFGDPVYDYENFKQGKTEQGDVTASEAQEDEVRGIHRSRFTRAGGVMNRLPRSGEEVNAIARLFKKKSRKCVVYSREQAAEEQAKAIIMKDFGYIHFACHGLLSDEFQSLVLSQLPSEKSAEDGYLTLNELMNCDYNAKLVVLSACRTGSGKLERVEGVTGLTQAVMYAGTPAVVASLWDVDDTATKELMVRFYKNMLEKNMNKTEALRRAKLDLLKSSRYSSPIYWSGFVMYGE